MPIIQPSKQFDGSDFSAVIPVTDALRTFRDYLETLDFGPGQRDDSAWRAFLRAGSFGVDPDVALEEVSVRIKATGGSYNPAKLTSQLRRAYQHVGTDSGAVKALIKPAKAVFLPEQLKKFAARAPGVDGDWLRARSIVPVPAVTSAQYLDYLYDCGERIVVFTVFESQGQAIYEIGKPNQQPLPTGSPEGVWYLVNPVDGKYHPNPRQDNKLSRRSEESVTSWRYLVLESDVADRNEWLSCLVQLPLRIASIYASGGKSIHALVRLDAVSKQDWDSQRDQLRPIVVTLGADASALTAVRLSRLPGAKRGDESQELLYLNPKPTGVPIFP